MRKALHNKINELAGDIGRLKRRYPDDHILERAAWHLYDLSAMLEPSAAEIACWHAPGDEAAITDAIRYVDERDGRLQRLLGKAVE
jgi:hypothetical protein